MKGKILLLTGILTFVLMLQATAAPHTTDYVINGNETVPIPQSYVYSHSINNLRNPPENTTIFLNQPTDLFIDKQDLLYVADTKNNRVLKMDDVGNALAVFKQAGSKALQAPQGVYVDDNGDIYIADTGNSRIVHLKADGTFVREFGKPESEKLADVAVYSPTKIAVSHTGGLYVLMGENIMNVDDSGAFRGFIGQTNIGFDFLDWLLRIVASDQQKRVISKRTAASYDNFYLHDGLLYACSRDTVEGQIKLLNSIGNNIYRKQGTISDSSGGIKRIISRFFTGNTISKPFRFGEMVLVDGKPEQPIFSDITVDQNGIVTVIEKQSGRFYQYDQSGNLLAVFGGLGTRRGQLAIPSSLAVDSQGKLYVLDSSYGNIQIFEPTTFITLVQEATVLYNDGDYLGASAMWAKVMEIDETYPLAHYGLASTSYKMGDWKAAMDGYRYANERAQYSKAFVEYRYAFLKKHFLPVVAVAAGLITALLLLFVSLSRRSAKVLDGFEYHFIEKLNIKNSFLIGANIIFRPAQALDGLKNSRGRLKISVGVWIMLLALVARFFFIYTVHYPLQDIELQNVNWMLEIVKILVPFLSWVISSYLLSSQFDGESTLSEIFVTSSYCLIPYIIVIPFAALISNVLSTQESGLFAVFVNGTLLWIFWLIFRSVRRLNDYSFGRTVAICVLSLVAMILIWFIAFLGYTLVIRIIKFFEDLFQEALLLTY